MPAPVLYTPDIEQPQPDEAATIAQLNEQFDIVLDTTAEDYGHAVRAVHAKAHAILEGTLTIDADLPPELAQGLFATPGEHKVLMRFSTNPGDLLDDSVSVPRGLGLKVVGVDGKRLAGTEDERTQDFVMADSPAFVAPDDGVGLEPGRRAEYGAAALSRAVSVLRGRWQTVVSAVSAQCRCLSGRSVQHRVVRVADDDGRAGVWLRTLGVYLDRG